MKKILLALLLPMGCFAQQNKATSPFKNYQAVLTKQDSVLGKVIEVGKFLVSEGYDIERLSSELGQVVTGGRPCPKYKGWSCRLVIIQNKEGLIWRTEGKTNVSFNMGTVISNSDWERPGYKGAFKAIMDATEQTIKKYVGPTGELYYINQ